MKRTFITLLLLAGCSAKMADVGSTTLQPLPTDIVVETIPVTDLSFSSEQLAFLDDVYFFYGAVPVMGDDELVDNGELWCQLMTGGMGAGDVIARINEGSADNDEAKLHFAIVYAGGQNLCLDQFGKVEEISLRAFPPPSAVE